MKQFFKNHPLFTQIVEYSAFTIINGIVQWGIYFLFVYFGANTVWVMVGFAISQVAAAFVSFMLNRRITFRSNVTRFLVFAHFGFYAVMIAWQTPLVGFLHHHYGINEWLLNLGAGLVFAIIEFVFMKYVLFHVKKKAKNF